MKIKPRLIGVILFLLLCRGSFAGTISVKDAPYKAKGDGVTDDTYAIQSALDAAFGSELNPHGTAGVLLNQVVYFPNGNYRITSPLKLTKLHGGRIIGDGRFVTKITQITPGASVIVTNGCGYSHFEGMLLQGTGSGTIFDLNWDGTAGGAALQSNTFIDMFFYGEHFGVYIGRSGFMGSENLFLNCFWLSNKTAGLYTGNWNALQQSVIGGNFQNCGIGIWAAVGSVPVIHGVGFQQSVDCDIKTSSNAHNGMSINGCRTESKNFFRNEGGVSVSIAGTTQLNSVKGDFLYQAGGQSVVSACRSLWGQITAKYWAQIKVESSSFGRIDWLTFYQLWTVPPHTNVSGCVEIENIWYGWNENFNREIRHQRMISPDNGSTIKKYEYLLSEVAN